MSAFVALKTGARLHYVDEGRGEPVVALHGFPGTARQHLGRVIDWLSASYRVLGPTLRGYGDSMPKPRDFPPDFYRRDAADVLAFMDALDIARAHVLGYSDGGEVALTAAGMQPERFLSATAWGAPADFGPHMRAHIAAPDYSARLAPDEAECALHGITDPLAFAQAWIAANLALIDSGTGGTHALAPAITCPVLVMLGREDKLNPEESGRVFVEAARHGRLVMFDGGHAVHDKQWESFKAVLGAFLAEASASRG